VAVNATFKVLGGRWPDGCSAATRQNRAATPRLDISGATAREMLDYIKVILPREI